MVNGITLQAPQTHYMRPILPPIALRKNPNDIQALDQPYPSVLPVDPISV